MAENELEGLVWGTSLTTGATYSDYWCCPNDKCTRYNKTLNVEDLLNIAQGVSLNPNSSYEDILKAKFRVIVECPECFGKYWHHIRYEGAVQLRDLRDATE